MRLGWWWQIPKLSAASLMFASAIGLVWTLGPISAEQPWDPQRLWPLPVASLLVAFAAVATFFLSQKTARRYQEDQWIDRRRPTPWPVTVVALATSPLFLGYLMVNMPDYSGHVTADAGGATWYDGGGNVVRSGSRADFARHTQEHARVLLLASLFLSSWGCWIAWTATETRRLSAARTARSARGTPTQ